jgi:ElaB/YqjD/DUF883 family membrane-anchored ribosome-binding protein
VEDIMLDILLKLAQRLDDGGHFNEADFVDSIIEKVAAKKEKKTKSRSKPKPIFESTSKKVKDNKDHFPIDTVERARNALARVNQYKKAPPWYNGSLESLVKTVVNAVHKKYPDIEVSEAAKKPGKG